jgi:hypothetical protein
MCGWALRPLRPKKLSGIASLLDVHGVLGVPSCDAQHWTPCTSSWLELMSLSVLQRMASLRDLPSLSRVVS